MRCDGMTCLPLCGLLCSELSVGFLEYVSVHPLQGSRGAAELPAAGVRGQGGVRKHVQSLCWTAVVLQADLCPEVSRAGDVLGLQLHATLSLRRDSSQVMDRCAPGSGRGMQSGSGVILPVSSGHRLAVSTFSVYRPSRDTGFEVSLLRDYAPEDIGGPHLTGTGK